MQSKNVISFVLLAFVGASVVYLIARDRGGAESPPAERVATERTGESRAPETKQTDSQLVAYYFHGNKRCDTCRKIEAYSKEAIESGFPDALETGRLEYRIVNLDKSGNEHFIFDFNLSSRSVVVAKMDQGDPVDYLVLDRVWDLTDDKKAFVEYVQDGVNTMLQKEEPQA